MLYDLIEDPSRTVSQLAFLVGSALSGLAIGSWILPLVRVLG